MSADPAADGSDARSLTTLSPLVRRMIAPNPGPMTYKGTNTYVVGHGEVAIIDPGPELPDHLDRLLDSLATETIVAILVTHTHRDHSPGATLLKARVGAPILGCAPYAPARPPHEEEHEAVLRSNDHAYRPDGILADDETFQGPGFTLRAVATPGHTANHLAFALEDENALFSGDHVMGWSTTVVAPPSGHMGDYMASLEKLRTRDDALYWPGHGDPVTEPQRFVRGLLQHRRQRESAILSKLRLEAANAQTLAAAIYENLDPNLTRAAAMSVLAHLEELERQTRIRRLDDAGRASRFEALD